MQIAADGDTHCEIREVYFADGGYRKMNVFGCAALALGQRIEGPAILEGEGSTAFVSLATVAEATKGGTVVVSL